MIITLKTQNNCGASPIETYKSVKDAELYLNEALYYSDSVLLSSSFNDTVNYDNSTKLSKLMRDAVKYGEGFILVYIIS